MNEITDADDPDFVRTFACFAHRHEPDTETAVQAIARAIRDEVCRQDEMVPNVGLEAPDLDCSAIAEVVLSAYERWRRRVAPPPPPAPELVLKP